MKIKIILSFTAQLETYEIGRKDFKNLSVYLLAVYLEVKLEEKYQSRPTYQ